MRTGFKLFQPIHIYINIYLLCRISFQGSWERVNPWLSQGITIGFQGPFGIHSGSIQIPFRISGFIQVPFRFHSILVPFRVHSGFQGPFRFHWGSIQVPFTISEFIQDPFRIHSRSQAPFRIYSGFEGLGGIHSGSIQVLSRFHSGSIHGPFGVCPGFIQDPFRISGSIQDLRV